MYIHGWKISVVSRTSIYEHKFVPSSCPVMYSQRVIVLDSKSYSVVKIRHSRCLHTIDEEKEGLANFLYNLFGVHVKGYK